MKKSNVILKAAIASALLAMAGSASAITTVSATSIAYATEQFTGTGAINVFQGPAITAANGTAIPTGGSLVTVGIALTGGVWNSLPAVTAGVSNGSVVATLSANSSVLLVPLSLATASSIGIGGNLITIPAQSAVVTSTGLATSGGTVTATASVYLGNVTSANLATATLFDTASTAATIATSTPGITLSAAANTSTSKIDLTATTPSVLFTNITASATETGSTTTYKLGQLTVKENAAMQTDGVTAFSIAGSAPAITATIAAPAGFFAAMGTTGLITLKTSSSATVNACTGTASATSVTNTVAGAASATAITLTGTTLAGTAAGQPLDVCMTVNGTTAIVTGTPTIAATIGLTAVAAPANKSTLAATSLQALASNGSTFNVRNYVPAAATGYSTFVRVINTGTLSAAVSVALVDETTGTAGTAGTLATLAAGAARNFTPAEIEAVTGAVASTARPRLRITAPTNTMEVQTFLVQPNGTVSDMTGAQ